MCFDLISASASHIYISALPLSPRTSMVREMYIRYARPLAGVMYGLPASWERVVAVVYREDLGDHVAWSPCNKFIAIVVPGAVEIRDAATLNLLNTFESSLDDKVLWLSFSPDGRILTQLNGKGLVTWDLQTGRSVCTTLPDKLVVDSALSSLNGKTLTVLSEDPSGRRNTITTHDLSTLHTHSHQVPEGLVLSPTWTHGESLRFATLKPGDITIWEVDSTFAHTPRVVESLLAPDEINNVKEFKVPLFLPTLSRLAIGIEKTSLFSSLIIWDARDAKLLLEIPDSLASHEMSFSSDGSFFAARAWCSQIYVWKEFPKGYILHQQLEITSPGMYRAVHLSPDGKSAVLSSNSTMHLWHTKNRMLTLSCGLPEPNGKFILAFSPDGASVALGRYEDDMVAVFDLQSGD